MAWDCNFLSKLVSEEPPGKSSCLAPGDTSPFLNIKNQSYIHPEPVVQFLAQKICTMKRVNVHLFAKLAMSLLSLLAGY
jgi:hypothetical protein